jgi:uncharacterized membrane protein YdbT with pleckstrin-like domain
MKYARAHPVTIFANLRRVLFLALIPLLRALWFSLVWQDILAILLMLCLAIWLWWRVGFRFDSERLEIRTGLLIRQTLHIPWSRVIIVSFLTHFSLAPFRAIKLRVETLGGTKTVFIQQSRAAALKILISGSNNTESIYKPTRGKIAALSLLTSNSFGGILYLSAFVSGSGKLLGRTFSGARHTAFERAASLRPLGLALGLPPAASALAVLLLAGWLLGFGRMFLRCYGFRFTRRDGRLSVSGGFLSRYEYHWSLNNLFYADIRQSLITKLLKLHSLYIRELCVIFTEKKESFEKQREKLLPELAPAPRQLKPDFGAILRFISFPLLALAAIWPVFGLIIRVYPGFGDFFGFAAVMAAALTCWYLAVKLVDFFSSGFSFDGKSYTLRYSKRLTLHTVVIPKERVAALKIRRSPLMRLGPYCDLILYTKHKSRRTHVCPGLIKTEVINFLNL